MSTAVNPHIEMLHQPQAGLGQWSWSRFFLLLAGFFLIRSLMTFPVENVDALLKYDAAARIVRSGEWKILLENQHTLRWIEVLPQILVTRLTDFNYAGLYLLPLLAFAASCALLQNLTWNAFALLERVLLAGLLLIEPLALNHTGQLLNPPFGVLFTLLGIVCLTRQAQPGFAMIMLSALMFICAYGAHVTYLAFAGGACLWLLLARRPSSAFLLGGTLLVLLLLETLVFNHISEGRLSLGRIQALTQTSHVAQVSSGQFRVHQGVNLLDRWLLLPAFNQLLVAGFIALGAWQAWLRLTAGRPSDGAPGLPPFIACAWLAAAAYAVAISVAVVDLDPLKPLLPMRVMYLEVFMPFAIIATVWLLRQLAAGWSLAWRFGLATGGALLMAALFLLVVQSKGRLEDVINNRLNAFAWRANAELADYSRRFAEGRLVIEGPNTYAMRLLATYQRPVAVRWLSPYSVAATTLRTDALCVANLRRYPIEDNYQDCKEFVPPKPPKFTGGQFDPVAGITIAQHETLIIPALDWGPDVPTR